MKKCLLIVFIILLYSSVYADQAYIWEDENGLTHITQQPPPKNSKVKEVVPYKKKNIYQPSQRHKKPLKTPVSTKPDISSPPAFAPGISNVASGEMVTLIRAMDDGLTYYVRTPTGIEIWKDRDFYYFTGIEERCTVIKSFGSEVLLYVPIMDAKYWFTVKKVGG